MTKAQLIDKIAKMKTLPNDTKKKTITMIVDAVFDEIRRSVRKEGKFAYPHFGTFAKRKRKARRAMNPRTKTIIKIPARNSVVFRPAAVFKDAVGGTLK
jgi:DNA-binding protein HU-beta